MKRNTFLLLGWVILMALVGQVTADGYLWPVNGNAGRNGPYPIKATFGEYRTSYSGHFNTGVAVGVGDGESTNVYPCVVTEGNKAKRITEFDDEQANQQGIALNNFAYIHLGDRIANDTVAENVDTKLGVIQNDAGNWMLLEEKTAGSTWQWGSGWQDATATNPVRINPLRPTDGLKNYVDTARGAVWPPTIHADDQGTEFTPRGDGVAVISGKVDILARADDQQSQAGGSNDCGAYELKYQVEENHRMTGRNPNTIKREPEASARFDTISGFPTVTGDEAGKVARIYDTAHSTNSAFYYWFTHTITTSGNWYTNESKTTAGTNAENAGDAQYPDGKYTVVCWINDIQVGAEGDQVADLTNMLSADKRWVLVDNWPPKIKAKAPEGSDVPTSSTTITVTFTEGMDSTYVTSDDITCYKRADAQSEWQTVGVTGAYWSNSGTISDENDVDVLTTYIDEQTLTAGWEYKVELDDQAFVDLAGSTLAEPHFWTFTVAAEAADPVFLQRDRRDSAGLKLAQAAAYRKRRIQPVSAPPVPTAIAPRPE